MAADRPRPTRPPGSAQGRKIEEVLDVLYRRRWIIAGVFLLVAVGAVAYVSSQRPLYTTSALVLIDLDRAAGGAETSPIGETTPFVRDNRSVYTELFVLNQSRGIRERVQERLGGDNGQLPPGNVDFELADRNVSSGIRINAVSSDPEAAAALANAYAEEYVAQTQIASRGYLTTTREFLQEQSDRLRGELDEADATLEGRMTTPAVIGSSALVSRLSALQSQRDAAQINLQTRRNKLASINGQLRDITPGLADRVSDATDRRVAEIEQSLSELRQRLQPYERRESAGLAIDESAARAIRGRISELEREKREVTGQFVGQALDAGGVTAPEQALSLIANLKEQATQERIEIQGLQGQIAQLGRQIGQIDSQLGRAPSQAVSLERAQQERAAASQTYANVASRLQQVTVAEESEPGYARVLKGASVPSAPISTTPFKTLGLALLAGLGLGIVLAVARDRVDNRVYKPEHVSALGVPVLEAVPDLAPTIKEALGSDAPVEVRGRPVAPELVTLHAPLSPASETFRHLRTAVQFSRTDAVVRTVVVTSAGAGEGKSTTSSNLAVTFAQAGRKTVLIDADFRRPRLHEVFGSPVDYGLAQVLGGRYADAESLASLLPEAFSGPVDNLFVIPTGAVAVENELDGPGDGRATVANPSELLGSPELRDLLQALLDVVDVVVIDTPPVLAATDAVLLSTQADATLLMTSSGKSKVGDVRQALAHLDDVGARVVGAVLNRFSLDKALGYAYTYGHYSKYGAYSNYGPYGSGRGASRSRPAREPDATTTQTDNGQ
ncbi:polysaccharide biosynthesis tyrosine autokinase [Rubrivirga sp. S365]|uniref:Polysaccharide biosynthesis tyrosine autokinase n=1 Tax=Rubrivirga litoralis TaxID=3075598 RepID=A0ABU3BPL0_9BACT|nr:MULTISPECIES: polysaccharide biosynthesis tyrosine autokinase [unclassified Rubrivirga]MDT0631229.1 polysaccharide biosynthesis tyrosine autokinase [Rubrivirga sp. F394]MDT7856628.1 polysaccharide biosynthesis tyrosine autokinase [Rubrivirga sp. S365]